MFRSMVAVTAIEHELLRHRLSDSAATTVYVVRHPLRTTRLRVQWLRTPEPLDRWCRQSRVSEAVVGGFFIRSSASPLGELWLAGRKASSIAVPDPFGAVRAAIAIEGGTVRIGRRNELPPGPTGDLLQAGPLLVEDGVVVAQSDDAEGFTACADQFDSDITEGRYPRAALGLAADELIAVACDGRRTDVDVGLTLDELGQLMVTLGAQDAINLDGGGSTSLVHRGHLLNRPYEAQDVPIVGARAIATALVFGPARMRARHVA